VLLDVLGWLLAAALIVQGVVIVGCCLVQGICVCVLLGGAVRAWVAGRRYDGDHDHWISYVWDGVVGALVPVLGGLILL
jgi:hypothetical protein